MGNEVPGNTLNKLNGRTGYMEFHMWNNRLLGRASTLSYPVSAQGILKHITTYALEYSKDEHAERQGKAPTAGRASPRNPGVP